MIVAGIDPGKTGALAVIGNDGCISFLDVPHMKLRGKDVPAYAEWSTTWGAALHAAGVDTVVIEDVAARPGQGVSSMFKFGRTLGFAHGVALSVRPLPSVQFVTPSVWKAKLGLLKSDKGASREKAISLFPSTEGQLARVKDDGRAEALLLAYYGHKFLAGEW